MAGQLGSVCDVKRMALSIFIVSCAIAGAGRVAAQSSERDTSDGKASRTPIRCAVIGGMSDTDFWPSLAERFTMQTGIPVETVVTGPKQVIATAFMEEEIDLITMHASDTILNLVADGFAENPQPWTRNDLVLVGPEDDPAGIRGEQNAGRALAKLIDSRATMLIHSSLGANEVLRDVLSSAELELDPEHTITLSADRHRQMLVRAQQEKAYTVVGRIPFLNHKIDHEGMAIMVQGDSRLRRPYVVATAPAQRVGKEQSEAARQLANFLRSAETQEWISTFGIGLLDDQPLFFPVVIPKTPVTNGQRLLVRPELFTNHPRHEQIVTQKDGTTSSYAGIKLQDLLATVGAPQGEQLKGKNMDLVVVVEASDGYQAAFSLVELMTAPDGSQVLLADRRDGQPIAAPEGPYRLVVPHDPAHFRWVRMVSAVQLKHAGNLSP